MEENNINLFESKEEYYRFLKTNWGKDYANQMISNISGSNISTINEVNQQIIIKEIERRFINTIETFIKSPKKRLKRNY